MSDNDPGGTIKNLFLPVAGRVYASRYFAHILYDELALELANEIDPDSEWLEDQSEFDLLTSAVGAMHVDDHVHQFLVQHYDGFVVNLKSGLNTVFDRNDNGHAQFIEIDEPRQMTVRNQYLPVDPRDEQIALSIFDDTWIQDVISQADGRSVLVNAMGIFEKHTYEDVYMLLQKLWTIPKVSVLFDVVHVRKQKTQDYFAVEDIEQFVSQLASYQLSETYNYFEDVKDRKGMKVWTKLSMSLSDINDSRKVVLLKGL